jgi:Tol biopolymer transport system component
VRSGSFPGRLGWCLILAGLCSLVLLSGSSAALPTGWSYSLVSPKEISSDINSATSVGTGTRVFIDAVMPLSSDQTTGNQTALLASRTSKGWIVHDLGQAGASGNLSSIMLVASDDAGQIIAETCERVAIGCAGDVLYEKVDQTGVRTPLVAIPRASILEGRPRLVGASGNLGRILFVNATPDGAPPLLPVDTHTHGGGLYSVQDGQLEFLGVDSDGTALPCGAAPANNLSSLVGTGFQQGGISSNGTTVAYESPDPDFAGTDPECLHPIDLYVRRDGQSVNVSATSDPALDKGATFAGMGADGRLIYFTTASQLVASDTDSAADLYVYDSSAKLLARLTVSAGVSNVSVSPDGQYVYFLTDSPIAGQGTSGSLNLFVYHAGAITHVATAASLVIGRAMNDTPTPTTPNGTHFLFYSDSNLSPGQDTGGFFQLFQYDAHTNMTTCVSCPSDGTPPADEARLPPVKPASNLNTRFQSDDGSRVVFQTNGSLAVTDTNNAADIYLWNQGRISLITRGRGDGQNHLVGMSPDGRTVFFTTTDRLVSDVDQDNDKLYAAEETGSTSPPIRSPECTDDDCQGRLSVPPIITNAGSLTFRSKGNQTRRGARKVRVALVKLGRASLRRLADTGTTRLYVRSNLAIQLRIGLAVRLGGRWKRMDHIARRLHEAGMTKVVVHLSPRARTYLLSHGALRIRLRVKHTPGSTFILRTFVLRD